MKVISLLMDIIVDTFKFIGSLGMIGFGFMVVFAVSSKPVFIAICIFSLLAVILTKVDKFTK